MEVFQTDTHYIFVKRDKSLWWNRKTSEFTIKPGKKNFDKRGDESFKCVCV